MARSWSSEGGQTGGRLSLESAHHSIKSPLAFDATFVPSLSWYAGEFWQPDLDQSCPDEQAKELIEAFLKEDILHAAAYAGDDLVAIGLVSGTDWTRWHVNFDRIELRSWRGTYDADVVVDHQALSWQQLPVA